MTPTLYEWAGGEPAFARLIDCFYDRVEGDDLLAYLEWGTRLAYRTPSRVPMWCAGHPCPVGGGARRRPRSADGQIVT